MAAATQAPGAGAKGSTAPVWYAQSPEDVAATLGADVAKGLTAAEAASRLQKNGPNALPAEKPKPGWLRFLDEYRSYMQIILLIAGVFSMAIGQFHTGVMVLILTVINAVVGLREEGKAESAMNALKSMMKATARVRRDGAESEIPAEQVVAGDTVLLAAGDQVPADGRIVQAASLQIDESALTGESVPASKDATALTGDNLGPGDQTDMAFMNTPVTHGSAVMIVTGTGADTEVGKIAGMLSATKAEQTPLTKQLNRMTLWIGAAALVTMVVMFVLGLQRGQEWSALFVTAIALAIAAIPEALPTVSQVILSMGAMDLAKRNAIVKNLSSVETLGSTSAINSDKTGTLTMNQMTVVEVLDLSDRWEITGTGYSLDGIVKHSAGASPRIDDAILPFLIANDAKLEDGKVVGDPTEGAMLVLAHKAGLSVDATREKFPRLATLPFDPTYKLMATFNDVTDGDGKKVVRCFVKGAAPAVGGRSSCAESGGSCVQVDDELKAKAAKATQWLGGRGLRVMAAAYRDIDPADFKADGDLLGYVTDLHLVSIIGMIDPPRAESAAAVKQAQQAHITVRMVTGDDVVTGAAVAKQIGIPGDAILGADFAALSEEERLKRIDGIGVVGRVAPEHKVLLAETLKKKGDVVAMTGDGVNDAPAIKAADIGIAMGTGTEVAKNAGRMILSDDNFATIVFAVEQGRKLFDNLNKYISFVLITLAAFVVTFLGATIFNIMAGEPFTATQILWINFLVDAPLGVALGFDKETPGLMLRKPRSRNASILTRQMLTTVGLTGLFMAVCLLWLLQHGSAHYGSAVAGTTMAMTAFAAFRIVSAFESRSPTGSVVRVSTFNSKQMNYIVLFEIVLMILVVGIDLLNRWLGTADMSWEQWGWSLLPAGILFVLWEAGKAIARAVEKKEEGPAAPAAAAPAPAAPAPAAPAPAPAAPPAADAPAPASDAPAPAPDAAASAAPADAEPAAPAGPAA